MALELAIICAVTGAFLGTRCSVLTLVPAVTFAMLFALIVGIARAESFWSIVLLMSALGAAVQMGYLAGISTYAAFKSIYAALWKGRDHALGTAMGPAWRAHTPQLSPRAIARLRRLRSPQV